MRKRMILVVALSVLFALPLTYAQTTDLFGVVISGTRQSVQAAIDQGADVNARDAIGGTPLMWAARYNQNPEVITTLLKAGADIKARDNGSERPLMWAAGSNMNPEVITTLLKAGVDINARDKNGMTALMWAAGGNMNPEVTATLLKAGADAKAKDNYGQTALDYAQVNEKLRGTDALKQLEEAFNPPPTEVGGIALVG